ncbi:hypothetical protein [Planktothrix paucivesiculata]|uniref:Uncharacterized protein n=1 Tax=Planktothrix paucivesiculata PCC 9631 TaxID=671071 RepID=A0A7Z9BYV6_9CYAN|nr:hypothetical protein [Planktothrix paucivesiculata]VXD25314.1 conserved hypothetical protein [Planktothrix paucivesiculata PCC 9631]
MNFPSNNPDPFNQNGNANKLHFPQPEPSEVSEEIEDVKGVKHDPRTVEIIQRSFIILTVIGLVFGVFMAAGVLYLMQRFNITGRPAQLEQPINR